MVRVVEATHSPSLLSSRTFSHVLCRFCSNFNYGFCLLLEWRERLETAHKMLHDSMTELITKKNYSEAERGLHAVDQLMLDVIEDMGGTVVRSGVWT